MEHTNNIPDGPNGQEMRSDDAGAAIAWLERSLPGLMRRLMDSEGLESPLLQLPLAQMRLALALYREARAGDDFDPGETMSALSDRLGVRQNALTQAADRLVNHGLAERAGDPRDRRVVRLRLTEQGRAWVAERGAHRRRRLHQLWDALNADERAALLQAVRTLLSAADRLGAASTTTQSGQNDGESEGTGRAQSGPRMDEIIASLNAESATVSTAPVAAS